jgi:hypothetical protein
MMRVKSKNIHVLPTENSSILSYNKDGVLELHRLQWRKNTQHIYITNDEFIEEGDFALNLNTKTIVQYDGIKGLNSNYKKIILTTDQDLIKDGVWGIEDGFLEWFVKNPSCEYVELKGYAIILPEESCDCDKICSECKPKQETLKEVKGLAYYKANAEEDYLQVPISVLRYISQLEQEQDKNNYSEEEVKTKYFIQLERTNYNSIFGKYTEIIKGIYELTDKEVSEINGKILIFQKMV